MFDNKAELMHNLDEMSIYLDWTAVLMRDLMEDYLMPLAHDFTGKDYEAIRLIWTEADPMAEKGEMIERFLGEIAEHYRALSGLVFAQAKPKDHKDMTRDERIAEAMTDITRSVEKIGERADWLERMKVLNFCAMSLGMGHTVEMKVSTAPTTYTMKE